MPITGFISQPAANSLNAAYSPITLRVTATKTGGTPQPPVVYCDIYINGTYYKTISKTQYNKLNAADSEWEFDIQDALQEYLRKFIAANGEQALVQGSPVIGQVFCRFRSSGTDAEGFIVTENIAPIQATSDVPAVAGTGTASNTFFVLNAALQNEDNPNLATHLSAFKHRTWDAATYPLTHRPDNYKVTKNDSDSFPIVTDKIPVSMTLNYQEKNSNTWQTALWAIPCTNVAAIALNMPNAKVGVIYNYSVTLVGTQPFALSNLIKPAWMNITIVGDVLTFSGLPAAGDVAAATNISGTVTNCAAGTQNFIDIIDINPAVACVPVAFAGAWQLPDAMATVQYVYDIPLNGDAPFTIIPETIPVWMTVNMNGSTVELRGLPATSDIGSDKVVKFKVTNCSGANLVQVLDTIDVLGAGQRIVVINDTGNVVQLTNSNGTITVAANGSSMMIMSNGNFTVTTMTGIDKITIADGMPADLHVVHIFNNVVQGNVLVIAPADLPNSRFMWIEPA